MTWTEVRNRAAILREVVAAADVRRDGVLPVDIPGVAETFRDDLDLVGALQLRWHTRLAVNVEQETARDPLDPAAAVARAYRMTVAELPGVRAVVDGATDHPSSEAMGSALRRARTKELTLLASAAGLRGPGAAATLLAARPAPARTPAAQTVSTADELAVADPPEQEPTFAARLRAAVAA